MGGIEMSNQINDGGPAFPNVPPDSQYSDWDKGMTLRDYFAAAALPEVDKRSHGTTDDVARECYQLADAMLKAREVK
jgi:hypothetical protein